MVCSCVLDGRRNRSSELDVYLFKAVIENEYTAEHKGIPVKFWI